MQFQPPILQEKCKHTNLPLLSKIFPPDLPLWSKIFPQILSFGEFPGWQVCSETFFMNRLYPDMHTIKH